jgi:hypothetical protein
VASDLIYILQKKLFDFSAVARDQASLYQARFESVRNILPTRGIIGYIGDRDDPRADRTSRKAYFLTQYTLAPLVLVKGIEPALIIANFHYFPETQRHQEMELTLLTDFGNGVKLFSRP